MYRLDLSDHETVEIQALLDDLAAQHTSVESPDFLRAASTYAHQLPPRLRQFLGDFKIQEPAGLCLISGYPIDDERIGQTPAHWNQRGAISPTLREELFFVLCGSLLGDVFGWSTQQNGYIMHDVLPIRGHENKQIGSGSEQTIWWHTEDAFHPCKGDYVGLMCMRNPDEVATTFAPADALELEPQHMKVLFEARFIIRPDESHLPDEAQIEKLNSEGDGDDAVGALVRAAYHRIQRMKTAPEKVPVMFGDLKAPYLSLDPYFMDLESIDAEARAALEALMRAIDNCLSGIVLRPGDCCFIDNYRAVHGRNPFKARYDGKDRWLKRLNVTRDLRKSRAYRPTSASRIIF